ncbi:MAG: lipopolysaccharide kinase InaA family protein [Prevotella sp.]|nr:lipopolysaccharide kinase InaA family protein [Prevotella sp.]
MKVVIDPSFSSQTDYISQIPSMLQRGEGEVVYDKRNRVVRFRHDGLSMMVKRFKRVNFIQQIAYTFFNKSKAERAFLFAETYRQRGIDTPQRVAYMEQSCCGLFSVGFFISLEAKGTETHLLLREVQDFSHDLADAVARQVILMHSRGILHGDLNLSNFLCQETPEGYHFTMIDINRSHFTDGWPGDDQCMENLVRLTHRRDLYEYLVRSYARQRGWSEETTAQQALLLLDRFENKRFKL